MSKTEEDDVGRKGVLNILGERWVAVEPVNHVDRGDRQEHREYSYNRVYVSDIDGSVISLPAGSDYKIPDEHDVFLYQYRNRPQVMLTQDGPYVIDGNQGKDGEKQAYFALSILDEYGYVGGFRRL